MGQTNINIRIDKQLKQEFDWICNEMGLNTTTAFNLFARTVVRQHKIPFEISLEPNIPNKETIEAIEEVNNMKKNPSLGKSYTDVDLMMKELLA